MTTPMIVSGQSIEAASSDDPAAAASAPSGRLAVPAYATHATAMSAESMTQQQPEHPHHLRAHVADVEAAPQDGRLVRKPRAQSPRTHEARQVGEPVEEENVRGGDVQDCRVRHAWQLCKRRSRDAGAGAGTIAAFSISVMEGGADARRAKHPEQPEADCQRPYRRRRRLARRRRPLRAGARARVETFPAPGGVAPVGPGRIGRHRRVHAREPVQRRDVRRHRGRAGRDRVAPRSGRRRREARPWTGSPAPR